MGRAWKCFNQPFLKHSLKISTEFYDDWINVTWIITKSLLICKINMYHTMLYTQFNVDWLNFEDVEVTFFSSIMADLCNVAQRVRTNCQSHNMNAW